MPGPGRLGIEPALPLDGPSTGVPTNHAFGYFSAAAAVGIPLEGIPAEYGSWEIALSGGVLVFGDGLKALNREGDDAKFIGTFGLSLSY